MNRSTGPLDRSTPGLPVQHQLPEFTQTHAHRVGGAQCSAGIAVGGVSYSYAFTLNEFSILCDCLPPTS